jgi:hypothetical protein
MCSLRRKADDLALQKRNYCSEIERSENRTSNMGESSKESYGSKWGCFSNDDIFSLNPDTYH